MSYSYQEIYQEGVRDLLIKQLAIRFPTHTQEFDTLLLPCTQDDLTYLGEQLLSARSFAALRRNLEKRLKARTSTN